MDADERPSGATTLDPHAGGAVDESARARWQPLPWVLERRGRISFQVQPFPTPDEPAPIERALAAARLAEELGFDAVSFGDHPLLLDCWVWLAAAAATTHRIRLGPGVACAAYRPARATARLATDPTTSAAAVSSSASAPAGSRPSSRRSRCLSPRRPSAGRGWPRRWTSSRASGGRRRSVSSGSTTRHASSRAPRSWSPAAGNQRCGWWPSTPTPATSAPRPRLAARAHRRR